MRFTKSVKMVYSCMAFAVTVLSAWGAQAESTALKPHAQQRQNRALVRKSNVVSTAQSQRQLRAGVFAQRPAWEIRTAPIAFMAKWLTLDLSYRLNEQWALGPAAILYNAEGPGNMLSPTYKGTALGVNGNYYFRSVYADTWYLSAHAYYENFKSYPHASRTHQEVEGTKINSAIGYQWRISRFNIMIGLGGERKDHVVTSKKGDPEKESTANESVFALFAEAKVGFQF